MFDLYVLVYCAWIVFGYIICFFNHLLLLFCLGLYRSTWVFLSRGSHCASPRHLLQHVFICTGSLQFTILQIILNLRYHISKPINDDLILLQLHYEAWVRFVILSIISIGVYAFYGQYHADPSSGETVIYHRASVEEAP